MKPKDARSMIWSLALTMVIALAACTTPRMPVPMPPYDSFVYFETEEDGSWLICIDPNPYLEPGSAVTFLNLARNIWVGGSIGDDGSFGCLAFRGAPGDLLQITIVSPSGEGSTLCFNLTDGEPVEDPYCGDGDG